MLFMEAAFATVAYVGFKNYNEPAKKDPIEIQEKDIDNNGLPEKYVEIEGAKYFLMVNGENVEGDILKGKNLEGKLRE